MSTTRTQRATGSGAISETLTPGVAWQLESIRLHLSAIGVSGNLTATINNGDGSEYDVNILTQDMSTVEDLVWSPERPIELLAGDELDIAWANSGSKTYGLEIVFKGI